MVRSFNAHFAPRSEENSHIEGRGSDVENELRAFVRDDDDEIEAPDPQEDIDNVGDCEDEISERTSSDEGAETVFNGLNELEIAKLLRGVPNDVLTFVATAFIGRFSNADFERLLLSLEDTFAESALMIWKYNKGNYSTYYYCNSCGVQVRSPVKCPNCDRSRIATFVRVGGHAQICEIVHKFYAQILLIRNELKLGKNVQHNLNSPFFSNLWRTEENERIHLSTILSIDGVQIPGNTKKIWPISLSIVDLPTAEMQRSTNIVLEGIVECADTPSTALWNSIIPFIYHDIESHKSRIMGHTFQTHITTCIADQPAKRAFFGMKAHHSSYSCFFCLSSETWYKFEGASRQEVRPAQLTVLDSASGTNGFGNVKSELLNYMLPFETPIDILHNAGEGLFDKISKEIFPLDSGHANYSDLFTSGRGDMVDIVSRIVLPTSYQNISYCRNGSDKTSNFRVLTFLSALESEKIGVQGQIVVCALGLLGNSMFSNSFGTDILDEQCCASARWFLAQASDRYFSIKGHELLYHLPMANKKFGNNAPLSTFSFESFYQFALMGYSSRTTRYFVQNACTKYLLHTSIRRELALRSKSNPCRILQRWLSKTPGMLSERTEWKDRISTLKQRDDCMVRAESQCFSRLLLGIGTLSSEYFDMETRDDVFFATNNGQKKCYRFVAVVVHKGDTRVLAEPMEELPSDEQFPIFTANLALLTDTDAYYGSEVLRILKEYDGISCCQPSGERVLLAHEEINGIAAYLQTSYGIIALQINGAFVHN